MPEKAKPKSVREMLRLLLSHKPEDRQIASKFFHEKPELRQAAQKLVANLPAKKPEFRPKIPVKKKPVMRRRAA